MTAHQSEVEPLESPVKVLNKKVVIQNSYSTNALMPNKIQIGQSAYVNVSQVSADEVKKQEVKKLSKSKAFESDKISVDGTPKVLEPELVKSKGFRQHANGRQAEENGK